MDVLIVGAGPVGLTLACELKRHGVDFRIVDRNESRTDKSKALVVWPRTLELLNKLGLAESFVESGIKIHGASVFSESSEQKHHRLLHVSFDELRSPYPFGLGIPQSETERLLEEALGDKVERNVELTALEQNDERVRVTLNGHEQLDVPWVVACDGARSTCRHALGVKLEGETVAEEFAMIDGDVSGYGGVDEVQAHFHAEGVVAIFPIKPPRYRVIAFRQECTSNEEPTPPTLEEMQRTLDQRNLGDLRLSDPRWLAAFRINERRATQYTHGRVFLAGDAAHVHSPIGGQGMNTGMQDVINLAWKLSLIVKDRASREPLLGSYSSERTSVGAAVIGATGWARRAITLRNPVAQAVRNRIVGFVANFDVFQQRFRDQASELAVHYPNSSLNQDVHDAHAAWILNGGVRPGERMPDSLLSSASGADTSLFEILKGTRFHLLLISGHAREDQVKLSEISGWTRAHAADLIECHWIDLRPPLDLPEESVWIDEDKSFHRTLGTSEASLYLVRPDGYVAFRCQPASLTAFQDYLNSIGLALQ